MDYDQEVNPEPENRGQSDQEVNPEPEDRAQSDQDNDSQL